MKKKITYEESVKAFAISKKNGLIYSGKRIKPKEIEEILLIKYDEREREYKYQLDSKWARLNLENAIILKGNGKKKAYFVCCKYIEFINNNSDFGVKIEKLPPLYNDMERQIEICKKMHSKFYKEEIGREFLVSNRTIEYDLSKLRYGDISVMGQTLQVDYDHMINNEITMTSTAHPLFLVQNLTQIVAMLNGLFYASNKDSNYGENAENTAIDIWMQLSEYAQNRILTELIDMLDLDEKWYKKIAKKANEKKIKLQDDRLSKEEGHFKNEIKASKNNEYLYILKNQEPCIITYFNEDGEEIEFHANYIKPKYIRETIIVCVDSHEELEIPLKDIKSFKTLSK